MDLKDYKKSRTCREYPNIITRYRATNAGQICINNETAFGSAAVTSNVPSKEYNVMSLKELVSDSLTNYSFNNNYNEPNMFMKEEYLAGDQTSYSQPMTSMSANAFNAQNTPYSKYVFKTPRYDHKLNCEDFNQFNNRHGALSSSEILGDHNNKVEENERREKNTYPHRFSNWNNQELMYKIMQRNAKLQKIVRKLLIEREREKQKEAWNNYINDLKNKHRYYSNEPSRIAPQYVPGDHNTPEMIDKYYNLRFNLRPSSPCQQLLEDFNVTHNDMPSTTHSRFSQNYDSDIMPPHFGSFIYDNDRFCYPTASQSYILRLNKEGFTYNCHTRPAGKNLHSCGVVGNNRQCGFDGLQNSVGSYSHVSPHTRKPRGTPIYFQTANLPLVNEEDYKELNVSRPEIYQKDKSIPNSREAIAQHTTGLPLKQQYLKRPIHDVVPNTKENIKLNKDVNSTKHQFLSPSKLKPFKNKLVEKSCSIQKSKNDEYLHIQRSFDEKFKNVTDSIIKLKQKIHRSEENTKLKSLATIEYKIDGLMEFMNSVMIEIQAKRNTILSRNSTAVSACKMVTASQTVLNGHSSDPYNSKNSEYICAMVQRSRSLTISRIVPTELRVHAESSLSKMEKILLEEMKKSDKVKSDIEEILNMPNKRSSSLTITFDFPTKETSTEITDSLSEAGLNSNNKAFDQSMALNQRAMTIAVNTDPLGWLALLRVSTQTVKRFLSYVPNVNSYLSLLPLPTKPSQPHYTCNICGASFTQPSQLSSHVELHNSGSARDCCVCRHALDLAATRASLFSCPHCGQMFTRAYCCELHQQSCARQLGRVHDVTSSHILLQ